MRASLSIDRVVHVGLELSALSGGGPSGKPIPVNHLPTGPLSVNEDTELPFSGGNTISVTESSGGLRSVRLLVREGILSVSLDDGAIILSGANDSAELTLGGTQDEINAALATLVYLGDQDYYGSEFLSVWSSNSAVTVFGGVDITVLPVEDAPTNHVPEGPVLVVEDVSFLFTGGDTISVTAPGTLDSVEVEVEHGILSVSLAGGATIIGGVNNSALFSLGGTQVQINAALATLTYLSELNYNGPETLTVFSVSGMASSESEVPITVQPAADSTIQMTFQGAPGGDVYISGTLGSYFDSAPQSGQVWLNEVRNGGLSYISLFDVLTGAEICSVPVTALGYGATVSSVYPNGVDSSNNAYHSNGSTRIYRITPAGEVSYITISSNSYTSLVFDSAGNMWGVTGGGGVRKFTNINWAAHTVTEQAATGAGMGRFMRNAGAIAGRIYGVVIGHTGGNGLGYVDTTTLAISLLTVMSTGDIQVPPPVLGFDGNMYVNNPSGSASAALAKYSGTTGALLASLGIPLSSGTFLRVQLYDSAGYVWCIGSGSGTSWKRVNASTMLLDATIATNDFLLIVGEEEPGIPIFYNPTTAAGSYGKIGVLV